MVYLNWLIVILHMLAAATASWHALLYKRDSRAAFGWIGVCILFPLVGPLLYYMFGINRVENRARLLGAGTGGGKPVRRFIEFERGAGLPDLEGVDEGAKQIGLRRASLIITGRPSIGGNRVAVLYNGEQAYPPMLAAIEQAEHSIVFMTYIFETNETGRGFIEALGNAVTRGVDVKVMIDGLGEKYSIPRAVRLLKQAGVQICRFNPPRLMPLTLSINLRNHRKILVVDNRVGFTGGINIGDRHLVDNPRVKNPVADIHFSLQGPVIDQLRSTFADIWQSACGPGVPPTMSAEPVADGSECRVIVDGPDEDLDRLSLVFQTAVTSAQRRICVVTPYFLPSQALIGCLQAAALRGVDVQIVLPEKNNLPYVHWATRNMLWELLYYNIRIYYQPPPFAHSKYFLVDDAYVLVGSANLDPRSLRLNYELGVEIYDRKLASQLAEFFRDTISNSTRVTLDEVDGRSLFARTRDSLCWLFSPYL
jgi:cardiolipin synthase